MIYRLLSAIVAILFLISSYDQSHAAELDRSYYIPINLSKDQAIKYWKENYQNPHINVVAIADRFLDFQFDYVELIKHGFDVLNFNDPKSHVFGNISIDCWGIQTSNQITAFMDALAQSQITTLILKSHLSNEVAEGFVRVLEGGKKFKKVDMKGVDWQDRGGYFCLNDGRLFGDIRRYIPIYENVKKIGMAATGKVDVLLIDRDHSSTKYQQFDYHAYDPQKEYEEEIKKIVNNELAERERKKKEEQERIYKIQRYNQIDPINMDRLSAGFAGFLFLILAYYLSA